MAKRVSRSELILFGGILLLVIAIPAGLAFFSAVQESAAYNRLTGARTTWWDAMWVQLRVEGKTGD
jgi:hypothetical protein